MKPECVSAKTSTSVPARNSGQVSRSTHGGSQRQRSIQLHRSRQPDYEEQPRRRFDQHYNVQTAVDQDALFVWDASLSNHANDQHEVAPTLEASLPNWVLPRRRRWIAASSVKQTSSVLEAKQIDAYIATGRDPHHQGWQAYFAEAGPAPPEGATLREKMAHKLRTTLGKAIYRRRKCSVEPVFGIIKAVMGFPPVLPYAVCLP